MKRLKIMMLVCGMAALMAGCTPTGQQNENVIGSTANEETVTEDNNAAKGASSVVIQETKKPESKENAGDSADAGGAESTDSTENTEAKDNLEAAVETETTEDVETTEEAGTTEEAKTAEAAEEEIVAEEGTVQKEVADIEEKSVEIEKKTWDDLPQLEMNQLTGEWYELWDAELNSLWSRIVEKVTPEKKEELLKDQREWIKRKEANVKKAGMEAEGGSLQPQLENGCAMRYTRKRVYHLAAILAEELGESFTVPAQVEESLVEVDPTLDHVFEKFEGQWFFDLDRGAVIGVERSETQGDFAPEGSTWVVWETGGDIISDLDVIDYTDDTITFCKKGDGYNAYYMLRFNMEYSVELAYGRSLDKMDQVTVSK